MGVYKIKGSPFYYWRCSINGERYSGPTKQSNKRLAEAYFHSERKRILKEIQDGPTNKRKRMTLNEASAAYFDQHACHLKNASDYDYQLEQLVDGLGADTYMDEMTTGDLATLQAMLRNRNTRYGKKPSNRTVNAVVPEMARKLWNYCEDVLDIDLGKKPNWGKLKLSQTDERVRELSQNEEQRLFKNLRQDYHPICRFAILSGLRQNNLFTLKWSEVDFDNECIVLKVKSRKEGGKFLIVPLTAKMKAILSTCQGHHNTYVFTYICKRANKGKKKGRRYPFKDKGSLKRSWYAALKAAKIEDYRFHDNRHTAATRTLRASKNLKAVQKMLGHENITTTAKYAHAMFDDVKEAMNAVDCQNIAKVDNSAKRKRKASN